MFGFIRIDKMTVTSFASTNYVQCCRRHLVGILHDKNVIKYLEFCRACLLLSLNITQIHMPRLTSYIYLIIIIIEEHL